MHAILIHTFSHTAPNMGEPTGHLSEGHRYCSGQKEDDAYLMWTHQTPYGTCLQRSSVVSSTHTGIEVKAVHYAAPTCQTPPPNHGPPAEIITSQQTRPFESTQRVEAAVHKATCSAGISIMNRHRCKPLFEVLYVTSVEEASQGSAYVRGLHTSGVCIRQVAAPGQIPVPGWLVQNHPILSRLLSISADNSKKTAYQQLPKHRLQKPCTGCSTMESQ